MLLRDFGAGVGFYVSPQKNTSSSGGSYIEAAISLLGITT